MPRIRQRYFAPQSGFPSQCLGATLIEVLISLLIVAVGLLGMAGLQTVSLRTSHSATLRLQALVLGNDMLERVLANRQGALLGAYDDRPRILNPGCMTPSGCDAAELAAHDLAQWQAALEGSLPAGAGTVCLDSTPQDGLPTAHGCDANEAGASAVYAVKIWWDEDRDTLAEQRFTLSFRP